VRRRVTRVQGDRVKAGARVRVGLGERQDLSRSGEATGLTRVRD
jgi:hypothetical protein